MILIILLLMGTALPVSGMIQENQHYDNNHPVCTKAISDNTYRSETSHRDDQLDQYYTHNQYARNIGNSTLKLAQTFKPSYATVTRLELLLEKESGPTDFSIYGLRLRSSIPGGTGCQLCQTSFNSDILNTGAHWYEFDILDQSVLPGATYYIEVYGIAPTTYSTNLRWCFGFEDPYINGDAYQYSQAAWEILTIGGTPCDFCFKTYGTDFGGNHPPSIPSRPDGPPTGTTGTTYTYATSSTDPDGDQIKYGFDWDGDGTVDIWSSLAHSGDSCSKSHTWNDVGTYQVAVKAQDEHGRETPWSEPLSVKIPKERTQDLIQMLCDMFLKEHPSLASICRTVLGIT